MRLHIENCTHLEQISIGSHSFALTPGKAIEYTNMTLLSIVIDKWRVIDLPTLSSLKFDYHAGDNFWTVVANGVGMEDMDVLIGDGAFSDLRVYNQGEGNNVDINKYFSERSGQTPSTDRPLDKEDVVDY